jgi:thymidylate synthase (FAD)
MRRFAPEGLATGLVWTANIRTLRHTIEARTDPGAEEEIRLVFGKIGELMRAEAPALFGDYTVTDGGTWVPGWRKVLEAEGAGAGPPPQAGGPLRGLSRVPGRSG